LGNLTTQRAYNSKADSGRYIFSWVDNDSSGNAGKVESSEIISFDATNFTETETNKNFRLLDVDSSDATNLINYIRGEEIAGYRSRRIDFDNDGVVDNWRLGDIIHSTPAVVGKPVQGYDFFNGDSTYRTFKDQYKNRRQVVYVGANDGMLHAFNGGFFNTSNKKFETDVSNIDAGLSAQTHPLGSEIWAYVPHNLLPHLQWLKDTDYPHVYFVDGATKSFDVNIFPNDLAHPNGWGTILVASMRFGGGNYSIDNDGDGTAETIKRSAYMLFDVTNPEAEPKLLAEITHPDLGYTTSQPAVIKFRKSHDGDFESPAQNDWYLVFGSGPTELNSATSTQKASVFVYNLTTKSFVTDSSPLAVTDGSDSENNSFTGSLTPVDWDGDYDDDAIYFGTIGGTEAAPTGRLKRMLIGNNINSLSIDTLLDTGKPYVAAPLTALGNNNGHWVFAGTGRLYVADDNTTVPQQAFYAVKDPINDAGELTGNPVNTNNLIDVTDIQVFEDGSIKPDNLQIPVGTNIDSFNDLVHAMDDQAGWKKLFPTNGTRNVNTAARLRTVLAFTDYTPSTSACQPEGTSLNISSAS
jgi:type IV pilus assembly protein PilY1